MHKAHTGKALLCLPLCAFVFFKKFFFGLVKISFCFAWGFNERAKTGEAL